MNAPRARGGGHQTRSYLAELLEAAGLRPRRQLGQNFLIDLNLLHLLVEASPVGGADVVLEVGAGTGGLTNLLARKARLVVSAEIDSGFFALASRETERLPNVRLLHTDALAGKNRLAPALLEAVGQALAETGRDHFHLVANLPYDVAAAVVGNLLVGDLPIASLTFTVQLEMAARIAARPGTADYGPLSVLAQRVGHVSWIRTLPPTVFWPRPKVHSAILRIDVDPAGRTDLEGLRRWYRFVRDLFLHRRKNLRSAIAAIPGYKWTKPKLVPLLESIGLDPAGRAEQLDPLAFERLHAALAELKPEADGA